MNHDEVMNYLNQRYERERAMDIGYSKMTLEEQEDMFFNNSTVIIGNVDERKKTELFEIMTGMGQAFYDANLGSLIKEDRYTKVYAFALSDDYCNLTYEGANQITIYLRSEETLQGGKFTYTFRSIDVVFDLKTNRKMTFAAKYGDYGDAELLAAYDNIVRMMNIADIQYATKHMLALRKAAFKF